MCWLEGLVNGVNIIGVRRREQDSSTC
jgi:hypothetical protein